MQKKHAKDDVVAVSVSLDNPGDDGVKEKVQKYLTSQKAAFTNLILDEKIEVWQKKLKIEGPPCVFVFDREGKVAKKFDSGEKYDEVEKLVIDLLKKK
jgi:cytochrome oxidase Cu insertion factor (SCO1/SenC/PrrC family)